MIVPSPELQISEAYRVLQPGGRATFTIWAGLDDWFTAVERVIGGDQVDQPYHHLYQEGKVREMVEK